MAELDNDMWMRVLSEHHISPRDLCNFALVCRRFHMLMSTNGLWRRKLLDAHPALAIAHAGETRWYETYRAVVGTMRYLDALLDRFAWKFIVYTNSMISYSEIEQHLCEWPDYNETFVIYALRAIVNHENVHENLTRRFYARQILGYIVRFRILLPRLQTWRDAMRRDLIEGADIFSQWFLPQRATDPDAIRRFVFATARRIATRLETNPTFQHFPLDWRSLGPSERLRVCEAILADFKANGYVGDPLEDSDIHRSILELVIERKLGRPITLCMLFYLVARALGVAIELVSYPERFLLKFLHQPDELREGEQFRYVDVWDTRVLRETELSRLGVVATANRTNLLAVGPFEVVNRMLNNHREHGAVSSLAMLTFEMAQILNPNDVRLRMGLARIYAEFLQFNLDRAYQLLDTPLKPATGTGCPFLGQHDRYKQEIHKHLARFGPNGPKKDVIPKLRADHPEVQHAVGQIKRHRSYDYTCVIADWDARCSASPQWQAQMGVHTLPHGANQPFYAVLVDDRSNRYAAQENLLPEMNVVPVEHADVGRYFERFDPDRGIYVMNEPKREQYPEDQ